MPAIETEYRGHLFRSRLEARWAAFFDLMSISWTYEPLDAHGYIPDFELRLDFPLLIEVKPASNFDELAQHRQKLERALDGVRTGPILIVGNTPLLHRGPLPVIGDIGTNDYGGWEWGPYVWMETPTFHVRWFPMWRVQALVGGSPIDIETARRIEARWGQAHRATRWTPHS